MPGPDGGLAQLAELTSVIPIRAGRQSLEAIAGSTLVTLETGHVPFASQPDRFLRHVEPFLQAAVAGN